MRKIKILFVLPCLLSFCEGRIVPIVDEKFDVCTPPNESAEKLDYSGMELIAEDDYNVYLNGTLRVLNDMNGPIKTIFYTEKFDRGQWHKFGLLKKMDDWCPKMMDPLESWYPFTSKYKPNTCPYPAGSRWDFDMQCITDIPFIIPPTFVGKWRMTMLWEYEHEGGKKECLRFKFDLVDV